jgi:hypothetical protein
MMAVATKHDPFSRLGQTLRAVTVRCKSAI